MIWTKNKKIYNACKITCFNLFKRDYEYLVGNVNEDMKLDWVFLLSIFEKNKKILQGELDTEENDSWKSLEEKILVEIFNESEKLNPLWKKYIFRSKWTIYRDVKKNLIFILAFN